ncbi:unnamed protein product [Cladocopium goreaui]|uniref:Sulfotransferase domain-containing protein n=1 Tax=Cladocopium goreaui TaxID=2562237 RepID=A0A9P1BUJ4_9DINO|nr:unnamed protein product [Cladocopium goreaui]
MAVVTPNPLCVAANLEDLEGGWFRKLDGKAVGELHEGQLIWNKRWGMDDASTDLFEIAPGAPWSLKTLERAPWVDKSGADSFFFTISCFLTFLAGPSVTKYGLKGSVSFFPGKIKT